MRARTLLAAAVLAMASACGSEEAPASTPSSGTAPRAVTVTASDLTFSPPSLAVDPGETVSVTLENEDPAEHSFTIDDLDFEIEAGGASSATSRLTAENTDGTFEFYCRYHPEQMRGELVVGAGGMGGGEGEKNDDGYDRGADYPDY